MSSPWKPPQVQVSNLGFTGTQTGMTAMQQLSLRTLLTFAKFNGTNVIFHHGDCIGADNQADDIAASLGFLIRVHPPDDPRKRAFCIRKLVGHRLEEESEPYLVRNADIAISSDILIACPKSNVEELRSGTWATVRAARRQRKHIVIIYPDGSLQTE